MPDLTRPMLPSEMEAACRAHGLTSEDFVADFHRLDEMSPAQAEAIAEHAIEATGTAPTTAVLFELSASARRRRPDLTGAPSLFP